VRCTAASLLETLLIESKEGCRGAADGHGDQQEPRQGTLAFSCAAEAMALWGGGNFAEHCPEAGEEGLRIADPRGLRDPGVFRMIKMPAAASSSTEARTDEMGRVLPFSGTISSQEQSFTATPMRVLRRLGSA
jgi:hypothetical protein